MKIPNQTSNSSPKAIKTEGQTKELHDQKQRQINLASHIVGESAIEHFVCFSKASIITKVHQVSPLNSNATTATMANAQHGESSRLSPRTSTQIREVLSQ
jgi:hypothetical protein